jgi:hypothetical protein
MTLKAAIERADAALLKWPSPPEIHLLQALALVPLTLIAT